MTTRSRDFMNKKRGWSFTDSQEVTFFDGRPSTRTVFSDDVGDYEIPGTQVTASEGHPWPPPKGSLSDVGGSFHTQKQYVDSKLKSRTLRDETDNQFGSFRIKRTWDYHGPVLAVDPRDKSLWPESGASGKQTLDQVGATAIARCKPDNSISNLATTLLEIWHGGMPHLPGSRTWADRSRPAYNAGSEYLNAQFGWYPLVSDIADFASGVTEAQRVLSQYERDAGKVVRRGFDFPIDESEEDEIVGEAFPFGPTTSRFHGTRGQLLLKKETLRKQWFRGAFTYYLPTGYDSRSALDGMSVLAQKLGLDLTPSTLWELTPWSWAVDWFSNTGDVIANTQSFITDGLVMRYGYVMEESITKYTYRLLNARTVSGDVVAADDVVIVNHTKQRRQANPYGFGVSWEDLSAFQTSILGALGLTRGAR